MFGSGQFVLISVIYVQSLIRNADNTDLIYEHRYQNGNLTPLLGFIAV
jgi:hypothetical protein